MSMVPVPVLSRTWNACRTRRRRVDGISPRTAIMNSEWLSAPLPSLSKELKSRRRSLGSMSSSKPYMPFLNSLRDRHLEPSSSMSRKILARLATEHAPLASRAERSCCLMASILSGGAVDSPARESKYFSKALMNSLKLTLPLLSKFFRSCITVAGISKPIVKSLSWKIVVVISPASILRTREKICCLRIFCSLFTPVGATAPGSMPSSICMRDVEYMIFSAPWFMVPLTPWESVKNFPFLLPAPLAPMSCLSVSAVLSAMREVALCGAVLLPPPNSLLLAAILALLAPPCGALTPMSPRMGWLPWSATQSVLTTSPKGVSQHSLFLKSASRSVVILSPKDISLSLN
mmetsp:Transcript_8857/g.17782  ORF Transcript_8857/g.17782 Transcript_8857/m.17782 type:complete len:347 (-) Transcript_8857:463-1503(-)